jgi:5'-3' exonuclease
VVCCWDNDWRPAWRVALLPSYKAHRVAGAAPAAPGGSAVIREMSSSADTAGESAPADLATQVPWIREVLTALGIRMVGADGYEADDVIGTLATTLDIPVDVVTGDRDLFQVVDDAREVRVLYIARGVGKHEQVDDAWVRERYGVPAAAYVDFATLRGDASDGLPGVAGIGEKTAATLLGRYGDMSAIVAAAEDPDSELGPGPRGKIKAAADYLLVAPTVVAVARDLEVDRTGLDRPVTPRDPDRVMELAKRFNLESPAARLVEALMR